MREIKPEMADFLPMKEEEMKRDPKTRAWICNGCDTPLEYDEHEHWWHCPKCGVNFKVLSENKGPRVRYIAHGIGGKDLVI